MLEGGWDGTESVTVGHGAKERQGCLNGGVAVGVGKCGRIAELIIS